MLAQNFKTAAELNVTRAEFDVLVRVLGMLEREEIEQSQFTMSAVGDCGTPACIMGYCHQLNPKTFPLLSMRDDLYDGLFMFGDNRRHGVTREHAASGLRNFLTFGDPQWDDVLSTQFR